MKALYRKRLLKLAEHLEKGKLAHKKFDFSAYNVEKHDYVPAVRKCGYAGCAIGECPAIFPRQWTWGYTEPHLRNYNGALESALESAIRFFGLNMSEAAHLFIPEEQTTYYYGGRFLTERARRGSVARNIRAFVAIKEREAKKAQ